MKIVIPTNRDTVKSIENFPQELLDVTDIVTHHQPKDKYDIGWMRQQYVDEYMLDDVDNIIMLDDDLIFQVRDLDDKYVNAEPSDILDMFNRLQSWLDDGEPFVGVSNRFMVNTKPDVYYTSAPSMIYGLSLTFMDEHNIRFDEVPLCEDWHVALSMYRKGAIGKFTSEWCVTDVSGGKGGLENLRDREAVRCSMFKFKELHDEFVVIREKAGGKQQRHVTDLSMTVQWKKAYQSSGAG